MNIIIEFLKVCGPSGKVTHQQMLKIALAGNMHVGQLENIRRYFHTGLHWKLHSEAPLRRIARRLGTMGAEGPFIDPMTNITYNVPVEARGFDRCEPHSSKYTRTIRARKHLAVYVPYRYDVIYVNELTTVKVTPNTICLDKPNETQRKLSKGLNKLILRYDIIEIENDVTVYHVHLLESNKVVIRYIAESSGLLSCGKTPASVKRGVLKQITNKVAKEITHDYH